jgi:endo-1,4-beta-xylanase
MVLLNALLLVVSTTLALTAPSANLTARGGTPSSEGVHNGFFYAWLTDNGAEATYTNGPKGNYAYAALPV